MSEIVVLQDRQSNGELEPMCDFAPDYSELQTHEGVLPSGLEVELKSFDSKDKKGMVLYTGPKNNHALLVAKSTIAEPLVGLLPGG